MFTGLIEELGKVKQIEKGLKSARIIIQAKKILDGTRVGDSINTNGVCLTVTGISTRSFSVDVMPETMKRSNLHILSSGDEINLERALKVNDRLGGHLVTGHIDGMGTIVNFKNEENAVWITIAAAPKMLLYIVQKGSIAIDGVSLTVTYVDDYVFKVSIIPHTKKTTTLVKKKIGGIVNLECDVVSKYIEKIILSKQEKLVEKKIDMNFLTEHGFI
ncbi:MAG: riboflavin synthase [Epulopiscium sp.]|nr:riboflavin synthase [Candidatus Epulonipiscium sp.]